MPFKIAISKKDRVAARFLSQVHSALSIAFLEAKKERKLTQRSLCESLDVDKAVVSRILAGGGNPTARTIAEFASVMGYRPELVLHRVEVKPETNHALWHEVEERGNSVDIVMVGRNATAAGQNSVFIPRPSASVGVHP